MCVERIWFEYGLKLIPDDWTRIWVACPAPIDQDSAQTWYDDLIGWAKDPDRPGEFAVCEDWPEGRSDRWWHVAFSDADIAFEFKMRWA